jgi:hypothetical protein
MSASGRSVPRSSSIPASSLRAKTNSELERIVRNNIDDPEVLLAVHVALKGRTRKRATALRTEIRERLALDRVTGRPSLDKPIWTRAREPPRKPWYRSWFLTLAFAVCVVVGVQLGAGSAVWEMIHEGILHLGERWHLLD